MERRGGKRLFRRLQVHFQERGAGTKSVGFTTNISDTGLFVATNRPLGKGVRIRIEVGPENRGVIFEAEVAHALQTQLGLEGVRKSGMGVRFLSVEELVAELVPEAESAPARGREPAEEGVYPVIFSNREKLLEAFERDIKTGGLFVPTLEPKIRGELVTIELSVAGDDREPLRVTAKVVQCFEPKLTPESLKANLIPGMGVELNEFDIERIESWIVR